jgi:hypothetical protein
MKIIGENSNLRTLWDFLILLLIIISILLIPYQFAFQHKVTFTGSLLVYLIDLFFIVDIIFNFNTSYRVAGKEVLEFKKTKKRYLKTSFITDLIASTPFDFLFLLWPGYELEGISIVL